jgi:hypothetical protein
MPSPSPLLLPLPSTTIHTPTLCRERLRSTGLRTLYSPNGMTSVSCSVCATTQSGLSSTLLLEGCCGTDQNSLPLLPWVPMPTLLPVTLLNAPRTPGLPGSHVQHPSVQRSLRAVQSPANTPRKHSSLAKYTYAGLALVKYL